MKMFLRILTEIILFLLLVNPGIASPQKVKSTAKFKGIVLDAYRARIPNAQIVIVGKEQTWRVQTEKEGKAVGEFNIILPAGTYEITIEAQGLGFKKLNVKNIRLIQGASKIEKFQLEVRDCDDCNWIEMPKKK